MFNTGYTIARKNIAFSDHESLVEMQERNGVNMGQMLFSYHSSSNVIWHMADSMRKKIMKLILESQSYFSVLLDEATTVGNQTALIIYLRITDLDENPSNAFISLTELRGTTGADIASTLYLSLDFLWKCLPLLCKLFRDKSLDCDTLKEGRAKALYMYMLRRMERWTFVFDVALLLYFLGHHVLWWRTR